jgi:hypothetical protein
MLLSPPQAPITRASCCLKDQRALAGDGPGCNRLVPVSAEYETGDLAAFTGCGGLSTSFVNKQITSAHLALTINSRTDILGHETHETPGRPAAPNQTGGRVNKSKPAIPDRKQQASG